MKAAHVVQYQVTLHQPLLATALAGDPNEAVSFDYVPGSLLRGALIGKFCRHEKIAQLSDAADTDTQRLFFNGATRFLNAYPSQEHSRLLPVPRSLQHPKDEPQTLTDWAVEPVEPEPAECRTWKAASGSFCQLSGAAPVVGSGLTDADEDADSRFAPDETEYDIRLHAPERQIWVHTARTRRFGRAMPRERLKNWPGELTGAIYRYDALASGQTFTSYILCRQPEDAALFCELLGDEAMLGGARSAGYGKVRLHSAALLSDTAVDAYAVWRECGGPVLTGGVAVGDELRLTLLSDVLLRDANGQWGVCPHSLAAALTARLGPVALLPEKNFLSGTLIGGFNSTWGLPLPQLLAVAMGSVITLRADAAISVERLQKLEEEGLGERRAEGFGRVAVNWHSASQWKTRDFEERTTPPAALDDDSRAIAQTLVERMLRRRLDGQVVALAYEPRFEVTGLRSKAQMSRLRMVIAQELTNQELTKTLPSTGKVTTFIADIRGRTSARRQFDRARLSDGDQPLLDWLEKQLGSTEKQWNDLFDIHPAIAEAATETAAATGAASNVPAIGAVPGTTAGVAALVTPQMRTEYLLRFVDAVLARAVKEWHREVETGGET